MVLDPLSAFSVACNVLQVVDFGSKVLSNAVGYRKATSGRLSEQQNLWNVLQSLKNLNADLQASMPQLAGAKPLSAAETRLLEANAECLRLSDDFIDLLDQLQVKNRHAMLQCLEMSIKTLWRKEKIEAMENALSRARDNLNVAFLVYMNSKQALATTQGDILRSTTRVEGSILNAVTSSSVSIQNEIRLLSEQLETTRLDSSQKRVAEFLTSNRELLENLSEQVNYILTQYNDLRTLTDEHRVADAQQKILNSLQFARIQERRDRIHPAHHETYQWVLEAFVNQRQLWDSFTEWLSSSEDPRKIYWIYGKPGCGKSTLMRFLDENISIQHHMLPWAENSAVVRAQHFFWNPGHLLQKSFTGLIRSLLTQLLEQSPNLIPKVVHCRKWKAAQTSGNHVIDWTDLELRNALSEYILSMGDSTKVFLLVDGLDEFEGPDEMRDELIDLFINLASLENVKICLASRPWNIFQDAFSKFPHLRLEDLTRDDINKYITAQLHSHNRFQHLLRYEHVNSNNLSAAITDKAAGVFLWVRLVVKELLKGLRDGDGIYTLRKRLEDIPADLNEYFKRLMDSISHHYRPEASAILQIALHEEYEFISTHPLRLIDLSFMDEGRPDFALESTYRFRDLDLSDRDGLQFRLDSAVRRLNSRCMGLLECQYEPYTRLDLFDSEPPDIRSGQNFEPAMYPTIFGGADLFYAFNLTVDFLHRSCRDFLLAPETQSLLYEYTKGPYDAREYLRNSRLVQFVALERAGAGQGLKVGIASYLLSTLSLPKCRQVPSSAVAAAIMKPVTESLVQQYTFSGFYWYIDPSLVSWHEEGSSFLTLAIDFELSSYVDAYLTSQSVQEKFGRPILDYILRPRFSPPSTYLRIGNSVPNLQLLHKVLEFGANPNAKYGNVSVWVLFLCSLADICSGSIDNEIPSNRIAYFGALEMLIHKGAAALLPKSWLCDGGRYERWNDLCEDWRDEPDELFSHRWPQALPTIEGSMNHGLEPWYAVSHLLEHFRSLFGSGVDMLSELLNTREGRST